MAIKKMRPTSDGVRHMSRLVVPELSKVRPEKSLTVPLNLLMVEITMVTEQTLIDKKVIKDFTEL